ncbi:hypothetical protein EV361DRAFT_1003083 [Lentinula raphanica]|nr:hypothetical protein EV361DRAFT_1003083 [Lentinula raphanica]
MHTWKYREMREGQSLIDEKRALSCDYEAISTGAPQKERSSSLRILSFDDHTSSLHLQKLALARFGIASKLSSRDSGSRQGFAGNFLTIFVSKPFVESLSHLTKAIILVIRILFRQPHFFATLSTKVALLPVLEALLSGICWQVPNCFFLKRIGFKFYAHRLCCQLPLQKANNLKTILSNLTHQSECCSLSLPPSLQFRSSFYSTWQSLSMGMLTILSSPVPGPTGHQESKGITCYLVLVDKDTIDQRVYVGISKEIVLGLKYKDDARPGRITDTMAIGEPSFINLERPDKAVWIDIGVAFIGKEEVKSIAETAREWSFAQPLGHADANDFLWAIRFITNLARFAKTQINEEVLDKQLEEYRSCLVGRHCMALNQEHLQKMEHLLHSLHRASDHFDQISKSYK